LTREPGKAGHPDKKTQIRHPSKDVGQNRYAQAQALYLMSESEETLPEELAPFGINTWV
jgi:hypothetical protein